MRPTVSKASMHVLAWGGRHQRVNTELIILKEAHGSISKLGKMRLPEQVDVTGAPCKYRCLLFSGRSLSDVAVQRCLVGLRQ